MIRDSIYDFHTVAIYIAIQINHYLHLFKFTPDRSNLPGQGGLQPVYTDKGHDAEHSFNSDKLHSIG